MADDATPLPWSAQQWASLRAIAQESARRARVASTFLAQSGPLPPEQTTVPALRMRPTRPARPLPGEALERLETSTVKTLPLVTIASNVYLRTSEVMDPNLEAAKAMVSRAAEVLGRLEDAIIFNGQERAGKGPPPRRRLRGREAAGVSVVQPDIWTVHGGGRLKGLLDVRARVNLAVAAGADVPTGNEMVRGVVEAIDALEGKGHYGPFAIVLGQELFEAAHTPNQGSLVLPSDRILPFLDSGPLLRSSTLPQNQGVVLALGGAPVEVVVASDLNVRFVQMTLEPRYVLRISERFVLRIKEPKAVCKLLPTETGQPPLPPRPHRQPDPPDEPNDRKEQEEAQE